MVKYGFGLAGALALGIIVTAPSGAAAQPVDMRPPGQNAADGYRRAQPRTCTTDIYGNTAYTNCY